MIIINSMNHSIFYFSFDLLTDRRPIWTRWLETDSDNYNKQQHKSCNSTDTGTHTDTHTRTHNVVSQFLRKENAHPNNCGVVVRTIDYSGVYRVCFAGRRAGWHGRPQPADAVSGESVVCFANPTTANVTGFEFLDGGAARRGRECRRVRHRAPARPPTSGTKSGGSRQSFIAARDQPVWRRALRHVQRNYGAPHRTGSLGRRTVSHDLVMTSASRVGLARDEIGDGEGSWGRGEAVHLTNWNEHNSTPPQRRKCRHHRRLEIFCELITGIICIGYLSLGQSYTEPQTESVNCEYTLARHHQ